MKRQKVKARTKSKEEDKGHEDGVDTAHSSVQNRSENEERQSQDNKYLKHSQWTGYSLNHELKKIEQEEEQNQEAGEMAFKKNGREKEKPLSSTWGKFITDKKCTILKQEQQKKTEKKMTKRKQKQKPVKGYKSNSGQLLVSLTFPSSKTYQIGMKDLNNQWKGILQAFHE